MNSDVRAESWEGRSAPAWQDEWRVPALHLFQHVSSTSDIAARLAEAGASAGTIVIADAQSGGRGRAGRPWFAPTGQSILMSVVLRADSGIDPGTAPLRVGLATAIAIEEAAAIRVRIKWPNDLLHDGRKLAGVLCEAASGPGGTRIIAGIGINVHQRPQDFPDELRALAGSVNMAGGVTRRAAIVAAILEQLQPFRIAPPPLDAHCLQALADRDALRGKLVDIDGETAGIVAGIAPDGALLVRRADQLMHVRSGSVRATSDDAAAGPDRNESTECQPYGRRHTHDP